MIASILCIIGIMICEYFNIPVNLYILIGMSLLGLINGFQGKRCNPFSYVRMFNTKYSKEDLGNALACFIFIMYFYYRDGFLTTTDIVTAPFLYILIYFFCFNKLFMEEKEDINEIKA